MLKWFKKHFIPHEGNDHRPHFLRGKNTRLLIIIVLFIEFGVLLSPYIPAFNIANDRFTASILPSVLDDLTNQNRQTQHLAVLVVNPLLNKVAQLKADDMASKGYFAHTSPDGKAPWYWFEQVGYNYSYAGENLAVDFTDSQDVAVAWMNSPEHRANILKDSYTEIGAGVATGTYQGHSTVFVAQEFGKPANATIAEVSVKVPAKVAVNIAPTSTKVLGAEATLVATQTPTVVASYTKTNIFEKYLTSPRHIVNIVLAVIAILVAIALALKLFIRMDKRHPKLITNGLIVLTLIFGVYVANNYMASVKMAVTTSFASFQGEQFDQGK
jgi:Cysteine-rich secretory protein family